MRRIRRETMAAIVVIILVICGGDIALISMQSEMPRLRDDLHMIVLVGASVMIAVLPPLVLAGYSLARLRFSRTPETGLQPGPSFPHLYANRVLEFVWLAAPLATIAAIAIPIATAAFHL